MGAGVGEVGILLRMIGLMDCNNFFVSCERLFRPDLAKRPVAVLSSNDGCVVSRSQEVKDMGVPMGIPYFQLKDMYGNRDITLFSSNFSLYRDISSRVMRALKDEFSTCEIYSVDEAFFAVDGTYTEEELFRVRDRIMQKTGIPVSIGCAATKTLAKVASKQAKKSGGVCVLTPQAWCELAKEFSCGNVWGIGRQLSLALAKDKVLTAADFLALDRARVGKKLGVVGERLHMELGGISVFEVGEGGHHDQQSYMSTRSFGDVVEDKRVLMSAVAHHVAHIAEKLRADGVVAGRLSVIAHASRFGSFSHRQGTLSVDLPYPTHDTIMLTKEAARLLDALYTHGIPYKKAGVVASAIMPEGYVSGSLFKDVNDRDREGRIDSAADMINEKFGRGTVRLGVALGSTRWRERRQLISPEYTTKWTDIARVKAV